MLRQEVFDQRALSLFPAGLLLIDDGLDQGPADWLRKSITVHETASLPVKTESASAISR
jgi:hypothetical protein